MNRSDILFITGYKYICEKCDEPYRFKNNYRKHVKSCYSKKIFTKKPKIYSKSSQHKREIIWAYCNGTLSENCCYCCSDKKINRNTFEIGYIVSRSKGGNEKLENLETICKGCHIRMGKNSLYTFIWEHPKFNLPDYITEWLEVVIQKLVFLKGFTNRIKSNLNKYSYQYCVDSLLSLPITISNRFLKDNVLNELVVREEVYHLDSPIMADILDHYHYYRYFFNLINRIFDKSFDLEYLEVFDKFDDEPLKRELLIAYCKNIRSCYVIVS